MTHNVDQNCNVKRRFWSTFKLFENTLFTKQLQTLFGIKIQTNHGNLRFVLKSLTSQQNIRLLAGNSFRDLISFAQYGFLEISSFAQDYPNLNSNRNPTPDLIFRPDFKINSEHREGHPNYHRVNDIFKSHMKEDFLNKISDTIRIFSSSLDEEKEGMKLNIQNVHTEGTGCSK